MDWVCVSLMVKDVELFVLCFLARAPSFECDYSYHLLACCLMFYLVIYPR